MPINAHAQVDMALPAKTLACTKVHMAPGDVMKIGDKAFIGGAKVRERVPQRAGMQVLMVSISTSAVQPRCGKKPYCFFEFRG